LQTNEAGSIGGADVLAEYAVHIVNNLVAKEG
jgi:hypothetical protein